MRQTQTSQAQRGWRNENCHYRRDCSAELYFADHPLPLFSDSRRVPQHRPFHTYIGCYTVLYLLLGLLFGRSQRSFYRENYILPIIFCAVATILYQTVLYLSSVVFHGEGNLLYFLFRVLLPELVYMTVVTIPLYRLLFGINEWLELKEKYKYRLF